MGERDKSLQQLSDRWDQAGKTDAFWAVLSHPEKRGNRWAQEEFFQTGVDEIRDLVEHLKQIDVAIAMDRALDFGCGPGRLTQALAGYFREVDGVDISPSMIELGERLNKHPGRCHYHLNVANDLSRFGESSFDLVYSNITLQHMPRKFAQAYIREFLRVLKPQGIAVFQLPGRRRGTRAQVMGFVPKPVRTAYRKVRKRHAAEEMNGWPREQVIAYVGKLGAELVEVLPSHDAGDAWESFRYTWRRRPSGAVA